MGSALLEVRTSDPATQGAVTRPRAEPRRVPLPGIRVIMMA